jgi:hypothetical protein
MTRPVINLVGAAVGAASPVANLQVCQNAEFFKALPQQCGGLFGPLSDWAAADPVIAAAVLGAIGFGVAQLGQYLIGKMIEG